MTFLLDLRMSQTVQVTLGHLIVWLYFTELVDTKPTVRKKYRNEIKHNCRISNYRLAYFKYLRERAINMFVRGLFSIKK